MSKTRDPSIIIFYMYVYMIAHRPSSQGWAPRCPIHFVFKCGVLGLDCLSLYTTKLASVLYTCFYHTVR